MFKAELGKPSLKRAYSFNCCHVMFRDQTTVHQTTLHHKKTPLSTGGNPHCQVGKVGTKPPATPPYILQGCSQATSLYPISYQCPPHPRLLPLLLAWNIASSLSGTLHFCLLYLEFSSYRIFISLVLSHCSSLCPNVISSGWPITFSHQPALSPS